VEVVVLPRLETLFDTSRRPWHYSRRPPSRSHETHDLASVGSLDGVSSAFRRRPD